MGTETPLIRKAEAKDLQRLTALETECFTLSWNQQMLIEDMQHKFSQYFVAELNGKVIGYLSSWFVVGEAEIHRICVANAYRGKGYGKLLLLDLEQRCRAEDIQKIFLEVREENEVAIKLYYAAGYKLTGKRKDYYGVGKNALLMDKTLTQGI